MVYFSLFLLVLFFGSDIVEMFSEVGGVVSYDQAEHKVDEVFELKDCPKKAKKRLLEPRESKKHCDQDNYDKCQ